MKYKKKPDPGIGLEGMKEKETNQGFIGTGLWVTCAMTPAVR
jgi:hypothetical protein